MPRAAQKLRTRSALLDAARRLAARGESPSVSDAAREAGLSRATAYRYFADPAALALEAALDVEVPPPEAIVRGLADPRERALAVHAHFLALARAHEATFRAFLARTLDPAARKGGAATRGARRVAAYELALAPVRGRMPRRDFDDLVAALSMITGIEALIALGDVCGRDAESGDRAARAAAEAILDRLPPPPGG